MTEIPLVSVVIPAFNASQTLRETLESVSGQTHRQLEIIVVDDGSTDATARIVEAYQHIDPRVKIFRKENGGVASARNAGIAASSAEFIAFIDADDLWHPTKIAKQLALLQASADTVALVYSPFRRIDTKGIVLDSSRNHRAEGWVINRHFYVNIIGNGSSILIRKRVLEELGGYSTILLEQNAQGCEDLLLQLRIALRYQFATVPEYLVAYRASPGNMSSDPERMLRSALLAFTSVLAECPNSLELAKRGVVARAIWDYLKIVTLRLHFRKGFQFIWPYLKGRTNLVVEAAWINAKYKLRRLYRLAITLPTRRKRVRLAVSHRHFYDYDPADMNYADHQPMTPRDEEADVVHMRLRALMPLDAVYRPDEYFTGAGAGSGLRVGVPGINPRRREAI